MKISAQITLGLVVISSLISLTQEATGKKKNSYPNLKQDSLTNTRHSDYEKGRAIGTLLNIYRSVDMNYVDQIDHQKMTRRAADYMLSGLDPYTEYIPASEMGEFQAHTKGQYAGIGALISRNGNWIEIAEPYKDSPADRAGLKAGDRIVAIDGQSMKGKQTQEISKLLVGKPGTTIEMTVEPISAVVSDFSIRDSIPSTTALVTHKITRQRINIPAIPYSGFVNDSIGYIGLDGFTENCSAEFRHALNQLRNSGKMKGLIIDLRQNSGGILGEAIKIMSMLVPKSTVVLTTRGKTPQMNVEYQTMGDPIDLTTPIVVLIDHNSASASEIVAGGLQDLDRAVVMGQRSFGKGLVQVTRSIGFGDFVKITAARYYTPSGRCIQALDYANRDSLGEVHTIADSLIKEYRTVAGRKVYDGGGITPDVKILPEYMSKFTSMLVAMGYIDEFANIYNVLNPELKSYDIDDSVYKQFADYISQRPLNFESSTKYRLEELRRVAEREKYIDRIESELQSIERKIQEDKMAEIVTFATEIKATLGAELATRDGYRRASVEYSVEHDPEIAKAEELLGDNALYNKIVLTQDTER